MCRSVVEGEMSKEHECPKQPNISWFLFWSDVYEEWIYLGIDQAGWYRVDECPFCDEVLE